MPQSSIPFAESNDIGIYNVNVPGASENYNTFLTASNVIAPPGVLQISSFAFDDAQNDDVDLENEITDHWVEDNVAVQDHIGVRPIKVMLSGRVSELAFTASTIASINTALSVVENGLTQADAYLGTYAPGTTDALLTAITQAQNMATQIEQGAARVAQLANYYNAAFGGVQMNKQQLAYTMLQALRNARVLFSVYTPFQVFSNMAIENIRAKQPRGTKTVSEFSVTMKQIQFVNNIDLSSFLSQYGGRAAAGFQPQTSNGITTGVTTLLSNITTQFSNVAGAIGSI